MRSRLFGKTVLLALAVALFDFGQSKASSADINLGPPRIVVPAPPAVVLIPHSAVYFVPHPELDIFFHDGYWWSPRGSHWYHARAYNGPWVVVAPHIVPPAIIRVPKDYRVVYKKEPHIPYGQWKKLHKHEEQGHRKEGKDDRGDKKEHKQGRGHK